MTYTIKWEQELYNSENPLEAAKNCLRDIQNGDSLCFTVIDEATGKEYSVDLSEDDSEAVMEITTKN